MSKFSVRKPYTVLVGVILVIVLGIVSFQKMVTDLLPNISLPYAIVMTTYPGASPETVETVVTKPVEASMATVSNIVSVRSVSSENYSIVILEFTQSADMNAVSLEMRETLDQLKSYWEDSVGNPVIMKLDPDMLPVMIAAAGVEGMDAAQISAYVEDVIVPELESIEGVASVSVTGLLEESVNVVIRQEKIDEVNEKVFAALDEKMAEAEKELEEGRKKLRDSKALLTDSRKELTEGETELESGKQELAEQQDETTQQLADAKRDLLTAKADLEASKMSLVTGLTTARKLSGGIAEMDKAIAANQQVSNAPGQYQEAYAALGEARKNAASVSEGDANPYEEPIRQYQEQIERLKAEYTQHPMLTQMAGTELTVSGIPMNFGAVLTHLKSLDWAGETGYPQVLGILTAVSDAVNAQVAQVSEQRRKLEDALNAQTGGLGLDAYARLVHETVAALDQKLALVDSGLVEAEKGQLAAAIEFANANAKISLGEYQLESGRSQLDAAQEQIKAGEEQLAEGEEQFAEAKESAYEQADMVEILTVDTVKSLLMAQNFSMPAGYVTEDGVDFLVRVGDKPASVKELRELPLMDMHMDGVPVITLAQVAEVFYADNSAEIYTNVNGSSGILLNVQKQTGYSTGEVSDLLAARFDKLMAENPDLTMITLMDQGIYIDLVMNSIFSNLLGGGLLAVLILLFFLKDLRPTLIVAVSIPVSLVAAVVCMYFSGITLNVISLSGLALGIGMLVDNSIVVIENIYRLRGEGHSILDAAVKGAKEVTGAIVASTLTTMCVFLPIVFTEGITRQLFVDMGLTIAYSLLASLAIALTVVPAMASVTLTKAKDQKEGKILKAMVRVYRKALEISLKRKPAVFLAVVALLALSVWLSLSRGTAFMPEMESTQMTVSIELGSGATLQETAELTDEVLERILEMEDVENAGAMLGGASSSIALFGGGESSEHATTVYVVVKEEKAVGNDDIAQAILERTADLDAEISVETSSMDMSALGGSGISIQIRGRELDTLQLIAAQIGEIVRTTEGTAEVSDGLEETGEELRITIDRDKAVEHGLTVAQIFTQIAARLADGASATTLAAAEKDYDVYVMSGNDLALTRRQIEEMEINSTNAEGEKEKVILKEVADFESAQSLDSVSRVDQTRYIEVTAAVADGYNVGKVSGALERKLAGYELPDGYELVFAGENETINDAMEQVTLMLVLALVFIYLIMVAQFQSLLSPFIIMFTIPLAFTGGFFGLFVSGSEVSVIAMIGFVMLSGIIVNNGIVLIDYINQLRAEGLAKREAILQAGATRLRPVLMTALTTILGLSAMVFSRSMGSEMAKPMAIVTIGGLLYGTLLTLIVIPCIYDVLRRERRKKALPGGTQV
ncbi:MAG: efflux RND transporter permease subunit [Clostridium sp.]|nr:efflux RND transporter permease subunit [Clostridium sp.]